MKITEIILFLFFGGLIFLLNCQLSPSIKVVQLAVKSDPTVSFRFWFQTGSQDDPAGKAGLAEITAQMLTEGATQVNSYETILDKLYPMACGYSAQVDKEMIIIQGRTHKDNLEPFYQLFKEAILLPAFKPEDLARIKKEKLNYLERRLRYSNDEEFGKAALYQFLFQGTNYEAPNAGLIETVNSITIEDVKQFYEAHFTKDNLVAGIGGGFPAKLVSDLKNDFVNLSSGTIIASDVPKVKPLNGIEVLLIEKETESTAMSLGFPIELQRGSKDFYALWLANTWFGEHRNSSSHLYQVIREARGLNYGDYSYIEHFREGGHRQFPPANVARRQQIFEIWIRPVQNQVRHFVLRAALRELQSLVENGLTQSEFDLTKKFLKNYYLNYAPTTNERLGYKLDDIFYGVSTSFLDSFYKEIDKLTLEDVNQAITKHLQYQNLKIAMITKDAAGFQKALIENQPSPIQYASPKPAEVVADDQAISDFPLTIKPENITIKTVEEMFVSYWK